MQDYKASYILTKSEMFFLLSSMPVGKPSQPTLYAISEYLSNSVPTQDTIEDLVGKKLARKTAGNISVEPVVNLLVKSAISAVSLWEIRSIDSEVIAVVLRADALFLLITRYKHIEDNWKATPFQDCSKLLAELEDVQIGGVTRINYDGSKSDFDSVSDLFEEERMRCLR